MPLICFFGNSLADRFPTHAEQFNQNINSQGFGSANLARQSLDMFCQYMAAALMFGVQVADLRTHMVFGHFDARKSLSPASTMLYESILKVTGKSPSEKRPYIFNDNEQSLDELIFKISEDIAADGIIPQSVMIDDSGFYKLIIKADHFFRLGDFPDQGGAEYEIIVSFDQRTVIIDRAGNIVPS
jgi:phenylalanine ammonia-lyase